jgi:hypothetical protein
MDLIGLTLIIDSVQRDIALTVLADAFLFQN